MDKHLSTGNSPHRPRPKPKLRLQIEVVREIENIDNGNYFLELRFQTRGPRRGTILIPRSEIKYPKRVQDKLLDKGADFYFSHEAGLKEIKEALVKPPVEGRIQETERIGWHGKSFVWQGGTHGSKKGKLRFLRGEPVDQAELTMGTLEAWRSGLEGPCQSSKLLLFALAMGFAAPFLKFVSPNEGATFYIWGKTTTGKTLAKRALMSIFRRAKENDLMTFDHTVRTLDEQAAAYNDLVLVLNESERLDPKVRAKALRDIAYRVAGGTGRQRSKAAIRSNPDLENKKWLVLCIGSGETPAKSSDRNEGEEIRLVDIPAPGFRLGGIFNEHGPDISDRVVAGSAMAKATEVTILQNYGVAFQPFMEAVCADVNSTVARVKRNADLFVKKVAPGADAKIIRMVEKFGLVYAGAIEACKIGVAPWTEKRARVAIVHVCRLALKRIGEESALDSAIGKLRDAVQNSRRFPVIEKGQSLRPELVGQAVGFRRSGQRGEFVAVRSEDLGEIIGGSEIAAKVLDRLAHEEILVMDGAKRVRKVQVQGFGDTNRPRWYCFWYDKLINREQRWRPRPSDP